MRIHRVLSHRNSLFAYTLGLTLLGGLSVPFTPVVQAQTSVPLVVAADLLAAAPASAATVASGAVELSPTPPNDTSAVAPNVMVTSDDSGSMASNYMGDDRPYDNGSWGGPWRCASVVDPDHSTATDKKLRALAMNGVYFNPNISYTPPVF